MNKNIALTILLIMGFLLIGFVAGFMTHSWVVKQHLRPIREAHTEEGFVEFMHHIMQLTPEQQLQTDSIFIEQFRTNQTLVRNHRRAMKLVMDSTIIKLQPHVTPQQLELLEENKQTIRKFIHGNDRPPRRKRERRE